MGLAAKSLLTFLKVISLIKFCFYPVIPAHKYSHSSSKGLASSLFPSSLRESLCSPELILLMYTSASLNDALVVLVFQIQAFSFDLVTVQLYSHPSANYRYSLTGSPSPRSVNVTDRS